MNLAALHTAIPESQPETPHGCQSCTQQELGIWAESQGQIIV